MAETKATPTPGNQGAADKVTNAQTGHPASSAGAGNSAVGKPAGEAKVADHGKGQPPAQSVSSPKPVVAGAGSPAAVSGAGQRSSAGTPEQFNETTEDASGAVHPIKRSEGNAGPSTLSGFTGIIGGPFAVYGTNLVGDVLVNGRPVNVTSRQPNAVKGEIPADFEEGDAEVTVGEQTVQGKLVR